MKRICVYCGSSNGREKIFPEQTEKLAKEMIDRGIGLVYGGAKVGLMGKIASYIQKEGGEVIGVIPKALFEKEVANRNLKTLHVVDSMHERKALMAELSDGFIAMPGGLGTIEEIFEALTWSQLGFHSKPCGFLNINGYYNYLLKFLDHSVEMQFIHPAYRNMIISDENPGIILDKFLTYTPPAVDKAELAIKHHKE